MMLIYVMVSGYENILKKVADLLLVHFILRLMLRSTENQGRVEGVHGEGKSDRGWEEEAITELNLAKHLFALVKELEAAQASIKVMESKTYALVY